jgi:hypothetical protein
MKKLFYILCLLGVSMTAHAQTPIDPSAIENIKKSSVYLEVERNFPISDEEITTSGTGFFIDTLGHIATNYHVVSPYLVGYEIRFSTVVTEIRVFINSGTPDHKVVHAHLLAMDEENDLAILKVHDSIRPKALQLTTKEKLIESTPVWAFGFPYGETFSVIQMGPEITISKGIISALRHDDRGELKRIQIDASINKGNSGGCLIDNDGDVIGVINSTMGDNLSFAIPSSYLQQLMNKTKLTNPNDSINMTILSNPGDAYAMIDGKIIGKTPVNTKVQKGVHALNIVKNGYQSYFDESSWDTAKTISIDLMETPPVNVVINKQQTEQTNSTYCPEIQIPEIKERCLFIEHFEDQETFNTWKQNTGGGEERTWFLKDDMLHQYESNEMLHAISLGDSSWNDYGVSVKVRINNEQNDSRAGVIFRETEDGFYLFRIHRETDKAQLAYHCKQPFGWFVLDEKKLSHDISDEWHTMKVYANQNTISCMLDTQCVFLTDAAYSGMGNVGLYSVESKATFDSLYVFPVDDMQNKSMKTTTRLMNYWFLDNFDLHSEWWNQEITSINDSTYWYFTDASSILTGSEDHQCDLLFTKYELFNFSMRVLVSFSEPTEESVFDIILRKTDNHEVRLRFSAIVDQIQLILDTPDGEEVLKDKSIDPGFFKQTMMLLIEANQNTIQVSSAMGEDYTLKHRKIPLHEGILGFSAKGFKAALHQLHINSVMEEE